MKKLLTDPLFLLGLAIRLGLIVALLPFAPTEWYVPFLHNSVAQWSIDPWATWLNQGGSPIAFPYGYVMWLAFLPMTLLCKWLGTPLLIGYGLTLLMADFGLLSLLRDMLPKREKLLLAVYWLSPIVWLASYGLGLNDLMPVLLLGLSLYFTRKLRLMIAGALCVAAISAKLSMILALPFFFIYLIRNRALRQLLPQYLEGMAMALLVFALPFLFSGAGIFMLFSNPEMGKIYQFAFNLSNATKIYIVPLAYMVMLYVAWRVNRLNFEMFQAILGIAFLLVVLLTPASPGWFIWVMPLLVTYQAKSDRMAIALVATFSVLYVISSLLGAPPIGLVLGNLLPLSFELLARFDMHASSLLQTAMTAIGTVLAIRIWRETVSLNDYFRLSRKPFVIGIAGDSGAGKDTLVESLRSLFGAHSVTHLSGDDYHLWDRHKPMWQVMTHLNPVANDLENFARDLLALTDGKSIRARHYDHATGKMSRPLKINSNGIIIASSLHALYVPMLRRCYNLSIYLDIDEGLRRYYKLQRDVRQRGHSEAAVLASLDKREPDSIRYIRPQAAHADLIMSLQPIHQRGVGAVVSSEMPRVKLFVRSRNGLNESSLMRVLVGVCGLHVDMSLNSEATEVDLTIEGETSAKHVELAAAMLFPQMLEFLDVTPEWKDGVLGLMQLITLAHINQALNNRLI